MRNITRIILHCSASVAGINLSGNDIKCMHTNPVRMGGRGWRNPGYHYVIRLDGTVEQLLPHDAIANGVKGYNAESIHICYVGGLDGAGKPANTMTPQQHKAMDALLHKLHADYPRATFHGHREFAAKACPCFSVHEVFPWTNPPDQKNE